MSSLYMIIPIVVFLATSVFVFAVYRMLVQDREMVRGRLAHYGMDIGVTSLPLISSGVLRERRLSSIGIMDAILARGGWGEKTALDLARAAIPLRVGEYILARWLIALGLFVVASILAGTMIAGVLLGILGYFLPRLYVSRCESQRIKKFDDQLVGSISLIANSLRAGFGLLQGFEAVAREMPSPIGDEFRQVLHEISMGASAEEALSKVTERVRSDDLDLVVTAMLTQRSVGGNLSEILDTIAHTIRERVKLLRDVRTLTAQERLSGYIIGALPIAVLILISLLNRSYVDTLFYTSVGRVMLVTAAVLEIVGFYITQKIMSIEV